MKNLKLAILLVFSPLTFFGQQLTGLWTGALSNDSSSVRQDQSFEIALTEYKGKVYGYSRNTFIVNDTLFYIVKRVKGAIDNGVCEVKDDEIVSCNFLNRVEKGVKVVHTFRMNQNDSTWQLDGNWKTTQTKKYYSLTGRSDLAEEKNFDNSKIFPHLEELNLAKEIPFYVADKNAKQEAVAKQAAADRNKPTAITPEQQAGINSGVAINKPATAVKANTIAVDNNILVQEEKIPATSISTEQQATTKKDAVNKPATGVKANTVAVDNTILVQEEKIPATSISTEQQATARKDAASNKPATVKTNTIPVDNNILVQEEKIPATSIATEQQKGVNKPAVIADKSNASNVKTATVPVNNAIAAPEEKKPATTIAANEQAGVNKPDLAATKPASTPVKTTTAANNNPVASANQNKTQPVSQPKTEPVISNSKPDMAVNNQQTVAPQQPKTIANNQDIGATKTTTPATAEVSLASKFDGLKNFKPDASGAAAHIAERKTDAQQIILFKADSLMIAVYDNGEIDGDTVSVLLNGEVVMAKQGLKASASKKTIYLPVTADDEFTLVLYAENLGKYPPNTGLLVVYDGDERHYVRFSADLQKNAGVILKRKK